MSHLLAPQEEKRDSRVTQSEPVMIDGFLIPPQEEKLEQGHGRLDEAIGRMENKVNQRRVDHDLPSSLDELAQEKQQRDAILSGSSGVTGEDLGIAEKSRLVRRSS